MLQPQQPLDRVAADRGVGLVCILHGGFGVPAWLARAAGRWPLDLTVNDPSDHDYAGLPADALVTRNPQVRGFAENVNAALARVFDDGGHEVACVVNFDVAASEEVVDRLLTILAAEPRLAAVGPLMRGLDGEPTFSVGVLPTPLREFLRATGLRSLGLRRLERAVLRHTRGWARRNAGQAAGWRVLGSGEYLPWTCVAVRAAAWREVGPLDERFPLYAEDIDWSHRGQAAGWQLGVGDCGPVTHEERATRGPRSDALYEYSQLELHRKWGWAKNLAWQRRGLRLRRLPPLRQLTPPLDWPLVSNLDAGAPHG
jgi:GT2 family glycosyltransferase